MQINYNNNIKYLKQSDIRKMTLECNKHPDGINLSQGICDLPLPQILIDNANKAIEDGNNIYTRYDGIDELRLQISKKVKVFIPEGAYYLLADISSLGYKDCRESASELLKATGVATVPGMSFYENNSEKGKQLLRFCFAKKYDILKKACKRLKDF